MSLRKDEPPAPRCTWRLKAGEVKIEEQSAQKTQTQKSEEVMHSALKGVLVIIFVRRVLIKYFKMMRGAQQVAYTIAIPINNTIYLPAPGTPVEQATLLKGIEEQIKLSLKTAKIKLALLAAGEGGAGDVAVRNVKDVMSVGLQTHPIQIMLESSTVALGGRKQTKSKSKDSRRRKLRRRSQKK